MFLLMQVDRLAASSGLMSGKNNVIANRLTIFSKKRIVSKVSK